MMSLIEFVSVALKFSATVYGVDAELMCGDYDSKPQPCDHTAVTATGEQFNPRDVVAALPLPKNRIMRPLTVRVLTYKGKCVDLRIVDKKHERYIGNSGLDLSPGAVEAITGKPATSYWSGKIQLCNDQVTLTETYLTDKIVLEDTFRL